MEHPPFLPGSFWDFPWLCELTGGSEVLHIKQILRRHLFGSHRPFPVDLGTSSPTKSLKTFLVGPFLDLRFLMFQEN